MKVIVDVTDMVIRDTWNNFNLFSKLWWFAKGALSLIGKGLLGIFLLLALLLLIF